MLAAVKAHLWNVNGLRAVLRKNFLEYPRRKIDVMCLQKSMRSDGVGNCGRQLRPLEPAQKG
jgi:hypothetical protein